jgi:choline transport protein
MIATSILNGALGFIAVISFAFCVTDLEAALSSPTGMLGYAFIEVFYTATNSKSGATAMTLIIVVLTICSCLSMLATASRQTFALARDDGLFFPAVFAKVSSTTHSTHYWE